MNRVPKPPDDFKGDWFVWGKGVIERMDEIMIPVLKEMQDLTKCEDADLYANLMGYIAVRIATGCPETYRFNPQLILAVKKKMMDSFDDNFEYGVKQRFHS